MQPFSLPGKSLFFRMHTRVRASYSRKPAMKLSVFSFAAVVLTLCATADDRLRDAQAQLKSQGFYFGEVDGNEGNETNAALRRFQIRNGLSVTGKLDDETLTALGMAAPKTANTPPKPAPGSKGPKA